MAQPIHGLAWTSVAIDEVQNYHSPPDTGRLSGWLVAWKEIALAHEAAVYCKPGAAPKQAEPMDQTQAEVVQRNPQPDTVRVGLPGYGARVISQERFSDAIQATITTYAAARRAPPRFDPVSA